MIFPQGATPDGGAEPPTYQGAGINVWTATYVSGGPEPQCSPGTVTASTGGYWFAGSGQVLGDKIAATQSSNGQTFVYDFTRRP